jgi:hypothetical protein
MASYHSNIFFYFFVFLGFVLIAFSNPFLHYPYDAIAHLIAIDEMYHGGSTTSTTIKTPRLLWHTIWANIFTVLHLDSTHFFLRAKIIHVVQMSMAMFSIYYFSNVLIRNVFKNIPQQNVQYLSLWSVLTWLSVFATFSIFHQLVWSLWYSVNYQITLALFWYITALSIVLFLEKTSTSKKVFFIFQIILLSLFILQVHSMEFMYYLMYLFVLSLVFVDKVFLTLKKYYYILIPLGAIVFYFIFNYQSDSSKIFTYFSIHKFPLLYEKIISAGHMFTPQFSRSFASINELMYLIFYMSVIVFIIFVWQRYNNKHYVKPRIFMFLLITSLFAAIALFEFSAGLFSIISRADVVHRIYYSSSIFVLFPVLIYFITQLFNLKMIYTNLLIFLLLLSTFFFSKYTNTMNHTYYKNIQSIKNSFDEEKSQFHLTQENIEHIGETLDAYKKNNVPKKEIFYYARTDIAFVIKYIYGKKVYWESRRKNPNHTKQYKMAKKDAKYQKILFEMPKTFPKYTPYK